MASGSQEGGKRGSFQHDQPHHSIHHIHSNPNSTSNNHSLNDSTTNETNETIENQVIEMTNTRDGETNLNNNSTTTMSIPRAHRHHHHHHHLHHIITPNEESTNDRSRQSQQSHSTPNTLNTSNTKDHDIHTIGELPNYPGLSFAYKLQLILLFIEFIFIVFGLLYGILYILVNTTESFLILLIIFLMVHIVVYICLMIIIIKLFQLRFKPNDSIILNLVRFNNLNCFKFFNNKQNNKQKQNNDRSHIQNVNVDANVFTPQHQDFDQYDKNHLFIKRTMITFIILRIMVFTLLSSLIYFKINSNHIFKLLGFECSLILLIWYDWNYFYEGIITGDEKLKLGIYLDLITITKWYTALMATISIGEAIQNIIIYNGYNYLNICNGNYYDSGSDLNPSSSTIAVTTNTNINDIDTGTDNNNNNIWICNVHLTSYIIMSLSSLLVIIWIYFINKEKYLYKSAINGKIRFMFIFFASCWFIAIIMIIIAMINVFQMRFNIFDCVLMPQYLIFIIYLLYYVAF